MVKPRNAGRSRDGSLANIAAALIGSAAATQVARQPVPYGCDGDPCTIPHHHPVVEPEMPLTVEQQLNTYADSRAEGLYDDSPGLAYVGANGRRLMLRDTPEGLYVGGVLVSNADDARALAAGILSWAAGDGISDWGE